ncbi:uncharacterized protein J3D65DRAFT_602198 [Phyllosticta citribraziliensis]|uniref:Uncharacterized protein n=1 Tax=Phyllosticta citribraziliensis TaxID=989973 RepID=A0ABR1LSJ7_9PEZI
MECWTLSVLWGLVLKMQRSAHKFFWYTAQAIATTLFQGFFEVQSFLDAARCQFGLEEYRLDRQAEVRKDSTRTFITTGPAKRHEEPSDIEEIGDAQTSRKTLDVQSTQPASEGLKATNSIDATDPLATEQPEGSFFSQKSDGEFDEEPEQLTVQPHV